MVSDCIILLSFAIKRQNETIFLSSFQLRERVDKLTLHSFFLISSACVYTLFHTHFSNVRTHIWRWVWQHSLPLSLSLSLSLSRWCGKGVWHLSFVRIASFNLCTYVLSRQKGWNNPLHPTPTTAKSLSVQKLIKIFLSLKHFWRLFLPEDGNKIIYRIYHWII